MSKAIQKYQPQIAEAIVGYFASTGFNYKAIGYKFGRVGSKAKEVQTQAQLDRSASGTGRAIMKNPEVVNAIKRVYPEGEYTKQFARGKFFEHADNDNPLVSMRAAENLAKIEGMMAERIKIDADIQAKIAQLNYSYVINPKDIPDKPEPRGANS